MQVSDEQEFPASEIKSDIVAEEKQTNDTNISQGIKMECDETSLTQINYEEIQQRSMIVNADEKRKFYYEF